MDKKQQLHERIDKNPSDYHEYLISSFDPQTIIDMAGRISMMEDTHISMKKQDFSAAELDNLLQFENPLELLADYYQDARNDLSDFDFEIAVHKLKERPDTIDKYPLAETPAPAPDTGQLDRKQQSENRVNAETERIVAEFRSKTKPDSPNKTHYVVKISTEFGIHGDLDALFDSVNKALNQDTLYFSGMNGEKGVFAFVKNDPTRQNQFNPPKKSLVKQLQEGVKEVRERPAKTPEAERKTPSKEGR